MIKQLSAFAIVAAAFCAPQVAFAQEQPARTCGASQAMEEYIQQNPEYGKELAKMDLRNQIITQEGNMKQMQITDKVIPVVIHIMHDYGTYISREQVMDAMRILNEDFNKLASDTGQVIPAFAGIAADVQIEFRLAKLDPDGNCTDGITRTYTPLTNTAGNNVKDLIRWNPDNYLNVWVVNSIESGAGGYSYRPCVSNLIDGVVVLHTQFGSVGTSSGNGLSARTITHEVGHYLNLPHTWGGTNDPGLASNCSIDDGISDTPNTVGVSNQSCNTSAASCGVLNNVQNFMDYANCPKMFTEGQKAVMHDALENKACRQNLWSLSNLVATGTNDGFVATACAPNADFSANKVRVCEGSTVTFTNRSFNAELDTTWSYQWVFQGGTPATDTAQNPNVVYNTPGIYSVTFSATNAGGSDTITKTDLIQVVPTTNLLTAPIAEGFESTAFPTNSSDASKSWVIDFSTTTKWERTESASKEGAASMRIRHGFIPTTRENSLITPNIDVSNVSQPVIRFSYAYAKASASSGNDRLRIFYSSDCGNTWNLRFAKAGASLTTVSDYLPNFIPTADQWEEGLVSLPTTGLSNVMLKFESTSMLGNTLYLDNIRMESVVGMEDNFTHKDLQVFPNPSNGDAKIVYELLKDGNTNLTISNTLGQIIYSADKKQSAGQKEENLQDLTGKLPTGIYMLRLQSDGHISVKKLVVE